MDTRDDVHFTLCQLKNIKRLELIDDESFNRAVAILKERSAKEGVFFAYGDLKCDYNHNFGNLPVQKCDRCLVSLALIPARQPWHDSYLICPKCDSTYCIEEEFKNENT